MPLRLLSAFAVSLLVHGAFLLPDLVARRPAPVPPAPLQARLAVPPVPAAVEPAEPLLKNTLDDAPSPKSIEEAPRNTPSPPTPRPVTRPTPQKDVQAAQRKLSKHVFYPPEAVARGLEGDVRLIVKLAADGHIDDVQLAASSGHPLLDNAAIRAAYAMGSLAGASGRELIVPVYFRLQ